MTAAEVIDTARLSGWNVRTIPVAGRETTGDATTGPVQNLIDAPDKAMTVRTNPVTKATDYLGVVGLGYTPVQNEACAELLDLLVDASGAHFETAGSLRGGRQVFITLKLPEGIRIAGVDDLDLHLAVSTSHDGSMALRVDATPVRVVCANTQRLALKRSVGHFTFRHTTNVKAKIQQARQAIGITYAYQDAFAAEAERMLDTALALDGFRAVCEELWPTPPADASVRTRNNHTRRARSLRSTCSPKHPPRPTSVPRRGPGFRPWSSTLTSTPLQQTRTAGPNAPSPRAPSPGSSNAPTTCSSAPRRDRHEPSDRPSLNGRRSALP
jgi:phage/plasmid-like protein (TIGR03299 family)